MIDAQRSDRPERPDHDGDQEGHESAGAAAPRRPARRQRGGERAEAAAKTDLTGREDGAPEAAAEADPDTDTNTAAETLENDDDVLILDGELLDAAAVAGLPELDELELVRAERDEYLDALQRLQADFDNFRKRVRRQEEEGSSHYVASLVERLLPVLDALELAASHAKAEGDAAVFNQLTQLLRDALAREGLERIDAGGVPFEPKIHDAVAHIPAGDGDDQSAGVAGDDGSGVPIVDEVLRTGYSMKGKVLRPAMVKVRG